MNIISQDCADPVLYEEFSNFYCVIGENSILNYEKMYVSGTTAKASKIDEKIVEQVKCYFKCPEKINHISIYSFLFPPSYIQAITDLSVQARNEKAKFFIFGYRDPTSFIYNLPIDIIFTIVTIEISFMSLFPSVKDFQCKIFKKIDFTDLTRINEIKKEIDSEKQNDLIESSICVVQ